MVRKAKIKDVKYIHKILTHYANKALLLPRSLSEIYDHLRDFYVIESNEAQGSILAVGALNISWEDLGEIRSLAVCEDSQKKGLGSSIIEACLKEATELGLKQVFVLTMIKEFFARFGFKEVDKSLLPHKIWADCVKCPHFPDCNEIAMMLAL